jgi:hypothetical protein
MAEAGVGRLPVVDPAKPWNVVGMLTRSDLLKPRAQLVEEEMVRERFLGLAPSPPTKPPVALPE